MLKAGFAQTVISPPVPIQLAGHRGPRIATEIADDLMARAVVLSYHDNLVAVVSCDLIWLPHRIVERIRDRISRTAAIRPDQVLVACTHTHSGPDVLNWYAFAPPAPKWWVEWLVNAVSSTVFRACRSLVMVETRRGEAAFNLAVNRRHSAGGTVYREPDVDGPVDDRLTTLAFLSRGEVVAGVVLAAMHPVILGADSLAIGGDWCGVMVRELERSVGGSWMFLNGAAGDNNPRVWAGRSYAEMTAVGRAAALAAAEAIDGSAPLLVDTLWGRCASGVFAAQPHPYLSVEQAKRVRRDGGLRVEAQLIRLGAMEFLGLAGECLYETAVSLGAGPTRSVVSYANDYVGYLPLARHYEEGGYEPAASMLSREGAEAYLTFVRTQVLADSSLRSKGSGMPM